VSGYYGWRCCRHNWETVIKMGPWLHQRCRRCGKDRKVPAWEALRQLAILALGAPALAMVQAGGAWAWWGSLLGLLSQPFWLVSTWRARQWGMFFLSLAFTFAWGLGLIWGAA
jgi:hypothetical protein